MDIASPAIHAREPYPYCLPGHGLLYLLQPCSRGMIENWSNAKLQKPDGGVRMTFFTFVAMPFAINESIDAHGVVWYKLALFALGRL